MESRVPPPSSPFPQNSGLSNGELLARADRDAKSIHPSPDDLTEAAATLRSWAHVGGLSEPLVQRSLAHPRFDIAARALAANMLAAGLEDPRLDGIFKDAGRYVAAMLALLLHLTGGLTLPRLKAFCVESGFVSPGRARAILLYLRYLGYVEPLPTRERASPQPYAPTARFTAAWKVHVRAALEAAIELEPGVGAVLAALDRPEVFDGFCRAHLEGLFASAPDADQTSPLMRDLLHRHAGSQLMWLILTSGDARFPPRAAHPIPATAAAKRFSVSRIHVQRILDGAVQSGILTRSADGVTLFSEAGAVHVRLFFAQQLSKLLGAAAATLEVLPP